jgi:excisionase family DNA binding protein
MPKTKTKPKANEHVAVPSDQEVLTLAEAAAYLRVPEANLLRMVTSQGLPGRLIENEWRFLKTALQDWLRTPPPKPSKEAMRSRVGSWKDDPTLEEMLKELYQKRGRPMTEEGE